MLLNRGSVRRNWTLIRCNPILWRISSFDYFLTLIGYIQEHLLLSIASMRVCILITTITQHVIIRLILHLMLLLLLPHQHLLSGLREDLSTTTTRYGHPITLLRWFPVHVISRVVVRLVDHHWVELGWRVNLRRLLLRRACSTAIGRKRPCCSSLRCHLWPGVLITLIVDLRLLQFYFRLEILLLLGILIYLVGCSSGGGVIHNGGASIM
jgi:hypothetical protein